MIANNIEEKSVENKNKYSNLARPRASPVDFGSPIPSKKSYSLNEKNSVTKNNKLNNKLKSSNNSFSGQEKNIGYLNSSFQSDSSIKYNHHAPSTSSSLVDKIFTSNTPSKKLHFDPNEFSNPETSFYVNSDSILKSNNMIIFSVDSLNENIINVILILYFNIVFIFLKIKIKKKKIKIKIDKFWTFLYKYFNFKLVLYYNN